MNSTSWRTPTMPLPMENNPRAVFERLFRAIGGSASARLAQMRADRSILDVVSEDMSRLRKSLGLGFGRRLTSTSIRSATSSSESRRQNVEDDDASAGSGGTPGRSGCLCRLRQADAGFAISRVPDGHHSCRHVPSGTGAEFAHVPEIGVPQAHHGLTHSKLAERPLLQTLINTFHVSLVAGLARKKMRNTPGRRRLTPQATPSCCMAAE